MYINGMRNSEFVINEFQLPCQNGCKNGLIVLQQQQKPNKSHSDPIFPKSKLSMNFRN